LKCTGATGTDHNGQCYFPSTGTEDRSNCTLFSVRADGKQHTLFCILMDGRKIAYAYTLAIFRP